MLKSDTVELADKLYGCAECHQRKEGVHLYAMVKDGKKWTASLCEDCALPLRLQGTGIRYANIYFDWIEEKFKGDRCITKEELCNFYAGNGLYHNSSVLCRSRQ